MNDILTTNWTEKIKSNPTANLILNSNRVKTYDVFTATLRTEPSKGYLTEEYVYSHLGDKEWHKGISQEEYDQFYTRMDRKHEYVKGFNEREEYAKIGRQLIKNRRREERKRRKRRQQKIEQNRQDRRLGIRRRKGDPNVNNVNQLDVDIDLDHGQGIVQEEKFDGEEEDDGNDNENDNDDDAVSVASSVPHDVDLRERLMFVEDEHQGGDMWANVYIDNYTNIHHPKLRYHIIDGMSSRPLAIKPPSVFFSDV